MVLSLYHSAFDLRFENRNVLLSAFGNGYDTAYRRGERKVQFTLEISAVRHWDSMESLVELEAAGRPLIAGFSMINNPAGEMIRCNRASPHGSLAADPSNSTRVRLTYFDGFAPVHLHGWRLLPGEGVAIQGVDLELHQEVEAGERITIDRRWNVTFEPGKAIDFSLETPWPLYYGSCVSWLLIAALFGAFVVLKALNRTNLSNIAVYTFGTAIAINHLFAGLNLSSMSGDPHSYGVHFYESTANRFVGYAITEFVAVILFFLMPRFSEVSLASPVPFSRGYSSDASLAPVAFLSRD